MVWSCAVRGASDAASPDLRGVVRAGQGLRIEGMPGDGLAGVDEVQVAALDRGLGLQLARAAPGGQHRARAVLDHAEGPLRALEVGHEVGPDPLALAGRLQGARLLRV